MPSDRRQRLAAFVRRHGGPVTVWIGAVALVVGMLTSRSTVIEAQGLVRGRSVQVSPVEAGLLASVEVGLLQEVRRGQIVARMDDARLQAEAAVVAAEIEAVRRELELELATRQQDEASDRRRFANDVESCRLQVLEILAELEPDRVTLADLRRDVASYRELLARELVSVREYERVQAECDALASRVAEQDVLLARAREDLAEAERRRDAFERERTETGEVAAGDDAAGRALTARVTALERRLETVRLRCDALALTAPFDGVVTQIPACPGQVVQTGDPVVTLAAGRPEQIVVWLDEASVRRLQQRNDLEARVVHTVGGRRVEAHCPVARIGVSVVTMPEELWPAPNQPRRGRPVVLGIPVGLNVVPGEHVVVRWG